jgi:branched-chain amino acid transport system ATP-binding protein
LTEKNVHTDRNKKVSPGRTVVHVVVRKINKKNNTAILLVEQNANLALGVAHRGYVMESGRIVLSASSEELRADEAVRKAYLGI